MSGDTVHPIKSGFSDPVDDARQVFSLIREALGQPGRIVEFEPVPVVAPLNIASMATCLAMLDVETPLWLDASTRNDRLLRHLDYHCSCPVVDSPAEARVAVISQLQDMPALQDFNPGDPDNETTVIIQVQGLVEGEGHRFIGRDGSSHSTQLVGLPESFWEQFQAFQAHHPDTLELLFSRGRHLLGLPLSTQVSD